MTVNRLLLEADSLELTKWNCYLEAVAEKQEQASKDSKFERDILGSEG